MPFPFAVPRRSARRRARLVALATVAACAVAAPRVARAEPLVLEGDVPEGGPDHFFVPFEVPAGTREIAIEHDDLSERNVLDFGLDDPNGYRGWGGGTSEPTVVGEAAASRAYVPGPLPAGTWRVVVGKAKIEERPARWRLRIDLRTTPTLPADGTRAPYTSRGVLRAERRWYAGDFHVHSRESTDARVPVVELAQRARAAGLDFVELSDHNTVTQLAWFDAAAKAVPDLLLLPGIEYTTYHGHGNAIGVERWIDHRLGQPGGPGIDQAVDAIHAAGGVFAVNHPGLDLGALCIGCFFEYDLAKGRVQAVEVGTLGQTNGGLGAQQANFAFWEQLLAKGHHAAALGGSDDHGNDGQVLVGHPTTLVLANELSTAGLVDAVRRGKTVVKLDSPADAMVEIVSEVPPRDDGDTVHARSTRFTVTVTGGSGQSLGIVKNGEVVEEIPVDGDPFVHVVEATAPASGEDRVRAQVYVGPFVRTVTSHVFLVRDEAGPDVLAARDESGCTTRGREPSARDGAGALAFALGGAAVIGLVRRRRPRS